MADFPDQSALMAETPAKASSGDEASKRVEAPGTTEKPAKKST